MVQYWGLVKRMYNSSNGGDFNENVREQALVFVGVQGGNGIGIESLKA